MVRSWQQECYTGGLKLEVTAEGNRWDYLEATVEVHDRAVGELVECEYRNKNGVGLQQWFRGELAHLPFVRFTHYHSYMPRSAQRGLLIATLLRIDACCTVASSVVPAVAELQVELSWLGYPARCLLGAAERVAELRPARQEEWGAAVELLRHRTAWGLDPPQHTGERLSA